MPFSSSCTHFFELCKARLFDSLALPLIQFLCTYFHQINLHSFVSLRGLLFRYRNEIQMTLLNIKQARSPAAFYKHLQPSTHHHTRKSVLSDSAFFHRCQMLPVSACLEHISEINNVFLLGNNADNETDKHPPGVLQISSIVRQVTIIRCLSPYYLTVYLSVCKYVQPFSVSIKVKH